MNRWMAVLCPITTFGALSGGKASVPAAGKRIPVRRRWETEWAAHGKDLLRVLKAL